MRLTKKLLLVSGIFLLNACATPYQAKGFLGGYSDARLDENTVRVTFEGNGNTSKETVENGALYRCAELTLQNGYDYFVIVAGGVHKDVSTYTTPDTYNEYTTKEKKHGKTKVIKHKNYNPGDTYNIVDYKSSLTIKMFRGKKPAAIANGFDAHQMMHYLTPAVKPVA